MSDKHIIETANLDREYHCIRSLARCYEKWDFNDFYHLISDDCNKESIWSNHVANNKKELIEYFQWREEFLLNYDVLIKTQIVSISSLKKDIPYIDKLDEFNIHKWKLCLLVTQILWYKIEDVFVIMNFNEDWKINKILLADSNYFNYKVFWPDCSLNFKEGTIEYSEDDIMTEQELCSFWMMVLDPLLKKEWYQILTAQTRIDVFPNFVVEKDWEISFIVVSASSAPNDPILDDRIWEIVLDIADHYDENIKCYFAPISFWSADKDRFEEGVCLRWDQYYSKYIDLVPIKHAEKRKLNKKEVENLLEELWGKDEDKLTENKKCFRVEWYDIIDWIRKHPDKVYDAWKRCDLCYSKIIWSYYDHDSKVWKLKGWIESCPNCWCTYEQKAEQELHIHYTRDGSIDAMSSHV